MNDAQAAANEIARDFPFELLSDELELVERQITEQAVAFDPAVEGYVAYVCNTSGKRIRPALTLLSGGATGAIHDGHRKIAVTLELIHIATLVHDDIIDGAEIRRQAPTANAKWGSGLAVLLGDCLFAHALMLSTEFDDSKIGRTVAVAANRVCSGEIIQTQRRFDFQLTRDDYFKIIEMKTAELFGAAMELGGRLNEQSAESCENLRRFGLCMGTAYQIYDDCLDLVGDESTVGKTLRTDLTKGKLTLPILNLIDSASERQREKLNRMLIQKEPIDVSALGSIADYEGAIDDALATAGDLVSESRDKLIGLDSSDYKDGLVQITHFLDDLLGSCRS